jgi:CRISPR-associated protein Csb2
VLRALLLSIRFHDGRYHGRPEWPPSPARLFQALVAGAASGKAISAEDRTALAWLEQRDLPLIAAPAKRDGSGFTNYVPNNDLDSVGRDPGRVSGIRAGKQIRPLLFDARIGLLYAWSFDNGEEHALTLCAIAERLYQLGRGVDMAWAWGEIINADGIEARLAAHGGAVYRPGTGSGGTVLSCPQKGTLASLERRFQEIGERFRTVKSGRQQIYTRASKPRFAPVVYASPPQRLLFELRELTDKERLGLWPLARAVRLVERIRDLAAAALKTKRPDAAATVDRAFIGRDAKEADKAARIRIAPLPSIGSPHVVPAIRRVLVEVPSNCPLSSTDIEGAFSGLLVSEEVDSETGEVIETRLLPAEDPDMLRHYGVNDRNDVHRVWRSVTPVVLPEGAARRRIDPGRLRAELAAARKDAGATLKEAKSGAERLTEERRATAAVVQALRHAGIAANTEAIRVQREPFSGRGARAEEFAKDTRFAKERLSHVEITLAEPISGPLLIGDGRYLGLGLMAPARDALRDVVVLAVPALTGIVNADGPALVHAARRALMALARETLGEVPRLFSGHEGDGGRAASGRHEHVFIAADDNDGDGRVDRLIVAAPWACDRSSKPGHAKRRQFDAVVSRLEAVRAGRLGVIALGQQTGLSSHDVLAGPARVWESRTPYLATRHAGRRMDAAAALARDVTEECVRRGLPSPASIEILECRGVANGGGLKTRARLHFATAIRGPLLLGRDCHRGGGLFATAG